jgi:hypothetical protein
MSRDIVYILLHSIETHTCTYNIIYLLTLIYILRFTEVVLPIKHIFLRNTNNNNGT